MEPGWSVGLATFGVANVLLAYAVTRFWQHSLKGVIKFVYILLYIYSYVYACTYCSLVHIYLRYCSMCIRKHVRIYFYFVLGIMNFLCPPLCL